MGKLITKHQISYLTGTCYNFELEEFLAWFHVAQVCQQQAMNMSYKLSFILESPLP